MVLADLQARSRYNQFLPPTASDAELRYTEGMRAIYGVIFGHLSLAPEDIRSLDNAARLEAAIIAETE